MMPFPVISFVPVLCSSFSENRPYFVVPCSRTSISFTFSECPRTSLVSVVTFGGPNADWSAESIIKGKNFIGSTETNSRLFTYYLRSHLTNMFCSWLFKSNFADFLSVTNCSKQVQSPANVLHNENWYFFELWYKCFPKAIDLKIMTSFPVCMNRTQNILGEKLGRYLVLKTMTGAAHSYLAWYQQFHQLWALKSTWHYCSFIVPEAHDLRQNVLSCMKTEPCFWTRLAWFWRNGKLLTGTLQNLSFHRSRNGYHFQA